MKYLIAADFHGNIDAYRRFSRIADEVKPDKIILLGDLFDSCGYEPVNNELSRIYYPILAVKGNCDGFGGYDGLCVGFRGDFFNESVGEKTFSFTHGHIFGRYVLPPGVKEGDVVFYGHYHTPEIATVAGVLRVCVGSAGRGRGSEETYCVFDGIKIAIKSMKTDETIVEAIV